MKTFFTIITVAVLMTAAKANDTIPIINTVFHGVNTIINAVKPTTVVVQPVTQPVTVVTPTPTIYYINGQPMILQNGYYIPYIRPTLQVKQPPMSAIKHHKHIEYRHPPMHKHKRHR